MTGGNGNFWLAICCWAAGGKNDPSLKSVLYRTVTSACRTGVADKNTNMTKPRIDRMDAPLICRRPLSLDTLGSGIDQLDLHHTMVRDRGSMRPPRLVSLYEPRPSTVTQPRQ